ncbi:hypothetical protein GIB67_031016, partial [Kingdonia uniflora]
FLHKTSKIHINHIFFSNSSYINATTQLKWWFKTKIKLKRANHIPKYKIYREHGEAYLHRERNRDRGRREREGKRGGRERG